MHGLLVRSDLALEEPTVDSDSYDIEVRLGPARHVPDASPPGEAVVQLASHDRTFYSASRNAEGYVLRFPELCDFAISPDCRSIVCHPHLGTETGLIPILIRGTLVSLVLNLQGHHVLHASAVAVNGRAIAFAGAAGMGKSTCAALLCSVGGHLVSDDVLRVRLDPAWCFRGASAIRIRPAAADVVDMFEVRPEVRETPDGRLAVFPPSAADELPLAAIVVPYPRQGLSQVEIEPVLGSEAFWLLAHFGRLVGWQQEEMVRQQFVQVGDLIAQVPMVKANIPWGPPFSANTAGELLDALAPSIGGS